MTRERWYAVQGIKLSPQEMTDENDIPHCLMCGSQSVDVQCAECECLLCDNCVIVAARDTVVCLDCLEEMEKSSA